MTLFYIWFHINYYMYLVLNKSLQANFFLGEHVLKMSFFFVFRGRLQDVLVKKTLFGLVTRLQKPYKDVFETYTNGLVNITSRHIQNVFKTYLSRKLAIDNNTSSTSFQNVLQRWISTEIFSLATNLEEFMIMVQIF